MDENSNKGSKTGVIIVVIVVVLLGLGGGWYFGMYKPEQEAKEKARLERIEKEKAAKRKQQQLSKKKANYQKLIQDADNEFDQENWEAAQSLYLRASSLFPKEQHPQNQLALINEKLEEIAAKSAPGTVETINSETGKYYVVVSSSIDGDLAMDYGNKMAEEGNTVKIIEPFGQTKFYRVSLDNYDAMDQAMTASASFNGADGSSAWVLKY